MWFWKLRRQLIEYVRFLIATKGKRRCLFLGTPAHKNLGDHAIVRAQYSFLRQIDSSLHFFEFSRLEYETYRRIIRMTVSNRDLVVIDGGGNTGTLWPGEDALIRDILSRFRCNPTIVFPQTAYYEDTPEGMKLLDSMCKLINTHSDCIFCVRDNLSYEYFKEKVNPSRLLLCPDIVMCTADASDKDCVERRQQPVIGVCLRDDKECILEQSKKEQLFKQIEDYGMECRVVTTISDVNIHSDKREEALLSAWKSFRNCNLVITDRLHGMIFSAVTGTPCIALDNISHKVSGGYRWLENLEYIRLASDGVVRGKDIDELLALGHGVYNPTDVIKEYFEPILQFYNKHCKD
ncbi:MAG: polysaccharide pyruvyl transferase family protein [Lachnospiraceae bacterium]|nr:polysaccharide pyruvyl transferase family protein [Candidatus Colinaster equi]